jgi:hypothetical protein
MWAMQLSNTSPWLKSGRRCRHVVALASPMRDRLTIPHARPLAVAASLDSGVVALALVRSMPRG